MVCLVRWSGWQQVVAPKRPGVTVIFFAAPAYACARGVPRPPPMCATCRSPAACADRASAAGAAPQAEAELYRLLAPRVRRYGLRHLRDPHAAADLMQHVMTSPSSSCGRPAARAGTRSLLRARHMPADGDGPPPRRTAPRRVAAALCGRLPLADLHVAPRLDHQRVAECLERLGSRERSVLVITFYDDQPSEAVGGELGLSPGNVRVIRHRGLDNLRRCVDAGRNRV